MKINEIDIRFCIIIVHVLRFIVFAGFYGTPNG